jgi:hypothetical protein
MSLLMMTNSKREVVKEEENPGQTNLTHSHPRQLLRCLPLTLLHKKKKRKVDINPPILTVPRLILTIPQKKKALLDLRRHGLMT